MLTAAPSGAILYMNEGLRRLIGRRVKHVDRILTDLPPRSGSLQEVTTTEGARTFRLAVMPAEEGRSAVYFLPADGEAERGRREEPMGRLLSDWLEGLGRPVGDWLDEAAKGRGLGKPEVLRVRDTGTETFLQVTLGAAGGRGAARLVAVLNDATELKTLQAQFVQSQKMQAIGQLAGGVAHDFNNLLTAISGHCDLMLLRHDQGDPDYADLVQIHQNANRAASLVGQLLAFSRKQTLQPQVIDLRDTLSDLTHLLNRLVGERIKLTLHHEASLPAIRADKRQLEQVLMNLVVNARDAMPEGGEIRIETMERVLGDDLRRDRAKVPAGRYVVVKVEDHGSGIPEDKIGKIFEPFYTTKRQGEGTGLGLSTAYGIVKQSGGFIFVDSVVGSGTVFTLYFPAYDQRRRSAAEATLPPRAMPAAMAGAPRVAAGTGARAASAASGGGQGAQWAFASGNAARHLRDPGSADPEAEIEPDGAAAPVTLPPMRLPAAGALASAATPLPPGQSPAPVPSGGASFGASPAASTALTRAPAVSPSAAAQRPSGPSDAAHDTAGTLRATPRHPSPPPAPTPPAAAPAAGQSIGLTARSRTVATSRAEAEAGRGVAASGRVILLVEDEAPVRAFASRALRMRGHLVIEAENAEEALAILEEPDLNVDLFVTDVIMPGMDGPTWVRRALERRPGVKVVFVSGYAEDSFGEEQARIANSVFLPKPFSLSELTAVVQEQLG
ncbi:MAG: ATP-binding protein [Rhodobacteraceae bacterium]|nr:ATP-binding protein [Paracoccaceae bacterium]